MTALLNYTTAVPVTRTLGEIQATLARSGAQMVATRYDGGQPTGVTFTLPGVAGDRAYVLPVQVPAVHKVLIRQENAGEFRASGRRRGTYSTPEHAARVAWRIAKDWLEAQIALVQAGLAALDQVMLPYLLADGQRTTYELYQEHQQRLQLPRGVA